MVLMLLSMHMLNVDSDVKVVSLMIAVAMSFGLSGLATGLGGIFMDLKQRNPAAIISSFGGTLNLVLSLVFVLCVIFPFAVVFHFDVKLNGGLGWFRFGVGAAFASMVLATILATMVPLGLARRSLDARDY